MPTDADEMERQSAAQIERLPHERGAEPAQAGGGATSIARGREQVAEAPVQELPSAQQVQYHPPPLATGTTSQAQPAAGLHHRPSPSDAQRMVEDSLEANVQLVSHNKANVAQMANFATYWRNPHSRARIQAIGHGYVARGRRDLAVYLTLACWTVAGFHPLKGFPPNTHDIITRFLHGNDRTELDRLPHFAASACTAGPQDAPPERPPTQHQAAARTWELAEPLRAADLEAAASNFQETAARAQAFANRYHAAARHQADEEARAAAQRFNVATQPQANVSSFQAADLSWPHSQPQMAGFAAGRGPGPQATSFGALRPTLPQGVVQLGVSAGPRAAAGNQTSPSQHQGTDRDQAALGAQAMAHAQRRFQVQGYQQAQAQRQDQSQPPAQPHGHRQTHGIVQPQQAAHMRGLAQSYGATQPQGAAPPQQGSQLRRTVQPRVTIQLQEEAQPRGPGQLQGPAPAGENPLGRETRRSSRAKRNQPEGSRPQPRRSTRICDAEQAGGVQAGAAIVSPSSSATGHTGETTAAALPHRSRGQLPASR